MEHKRDNFNNTGAFKNPVNCWKTAQPSLATTQLETANVNAKNKDGATISSQVPKSLDTGKVQRLSKTQPIEGYSVDGMEVSRVGRKSEAQGAQNV